MTREIRLARSENRRRKWREDPAWRLKQINHVRRHNGLEEYHSIEQVNARVPFAERNEA